MKIKLIYTGKSGKDFLKNGENYYFKKICKYIPFELIELPDIKNSKNLSVKEIKSLEGNQLLKKLKPNDFLILLDEKGKEFTSKSFSEFIQKQFNAGHQNIVFIIGGPYGFSEEIYKISHAKVALSRLTFSHQMVRLFFLEQLYRGLTILKGEPYHHE